MMGDHIVLPYFSVVLAIVLYVLSNVSFDLLYCEVVSDIGIFVVFLHCL